jgi:hypothetical protein
MAAATANMAKVVLLLLLAMQILCVLAGAARPLVGVTVGWRTESRWCRRCSIAIPTLTGTVADVHI